MWADTWHLFNKYWIISLRMPLWSLFSLIQPLLWLFIFTALFKNFATLPGFPSGSYVDYFLPGVLIMTVLFGSSWSGVSLLREITAGTVDKMLVSPVSRSAIVLSRVMHSAVQVVLQVVIVLVVAWLMGANTTLNPAMLIASIVIILMLGIAFASISNGLAILMQREEPLVITGNLMTLPLMFFSSAMVPEQFMPSWIHYIAMVNPVEYAVSAVRSVLSPTPDFIMFAKSGLIVFIVMGVTLAWAISAFKALRD
jgi:ABC-2 type transport system permease protein